MLKIQIEALRRLKYRPTGGFCFSSLVDSAPAISSSILDADRVPKFACDTVQAACAPVLVVADPLPDTVASGESVDLDVHVVSDLRTPIDFAVVDAVVAWQGGERRWRFGGPVGADDVVKVGRLEFVVPEAERLPQLNAVTVPEGVDEAAVRSALLNEYNLEVGAGLGAMAGKIWRIGLMGYASNPTNVLFCLGALDAVLTGMRAPIKSGVAVDAARRALTEAA